MNTINLEYKNFYYNTSVRSNTIYSCDISGCDEEGICRCSEIENAKIEYVHVGKISNIIYEDIYLPNSKTSEREDKLSILLYGYSKELNLYTIDRILRHYKIWEPSKWDIEIMNGYYGQEIESVQIKSKLVKEIEDKIFFALCIEDMKERIEWLLELEYGSVLPKLKDCHWSIERVDLDRIIFGSNTNKKSAVKEISKFEQSSWGYFYSERAYFGIMGVVYDDGVGFRLIDGYHRLLSTKSSKKLVLVAKK